MLAGSIESAINRVAAKIGINRNALERIIYNESRGNPNVGMDKSNYSAGIAQISRAVWAKYSKLPYSSASKPEYYEQNMMVAAQYLKENYKRFGNWRDSMAGYNQGITAWTQVLAGKRKPSKITLNYIKNFKE